MTANWNIKDPHSCRIRYQCHYNLIDAILSLALSLCIIRVLAEVFKTFRDIDEICIGPQLNSCRFLYACIDEALRLSPPVGTMLPREILGGGLTVDAQFFPAGVNIGVPGYGIHHNRW